VTRTTHSATEATRTVTESIRVDGGGYRIRMSDESQGATAHASGPHLPAAHRHGLSRDATWALWLGAGGIVLGPLLMFAVLTPAAIVYGIRGLREIHARPELAGRTRAWTGITLGVIAPFLWVGVFVAFLADGIG
jgi:hypothetical protein